MIKNKFQIFERFLYKFAFSLAEMLMVMIIIGVIAMLSMPVLKNSTNEKELVENLFNFNQNLSTVVDSWKKDNNCAFPLGYCLAAQNMFTKTNADFNSFSKYMRVIKKAEGNNKEFWLPGHTLDYYGNKNQTISGQVAHSGIGDEAFLLQNGITFSVKNYPAGFDLTADVNGGKLPNRIGKDTFKFHIGNKYSMNDGCYPKDICYNLVSSNQSDNGNGLCGSEQNGRCNSDNINPTIDNGAMPTTYVILHKKLPDFKNLAKEIKNFRP